MRRAHARLRSGLQLILGVPRVGCPCSAALAWVPFSAALARLSMRSGDGAVIAVGSTDAVRYGIGDGTLFLEYLGNVIGSLPINRALD